MQTIVAIDQSLHASGFIAYRTADRMSDVGEILDMDVVGYSLKSNVSLTEKVSRMDHIAEMAAWYCQTYEPSVVIMEQIAFSRFGRMADLGGLFFVLCSKIVAVGNIPICVTSNTARKSVLGKGSKPKNVKGSVKKWIRNSLKRDFPSIPPEILADDNLCDAFVLALHAQGYNRENRLFT